MSATIVKTIIGACDAIRDSLRGMTTIELKSDITANFSFPDLDTEGVPPGVHVGEDGFNKTVAITGSIDQTWTRVPLGPIIDSSGNRNPPGLGNFYAIEYGCCCRCRVAYVFDNDSPRIPPDQDEGGLISATMTLSIDASDDAPPLDPPGDITVTARFWPANAAPCRVSGDPGLPGTVLQMVGNVPLPSTPGNYEYQDPLDPTHLLAIVLVTGTAGAEIGAGQSDESHDVNFTTPDPCSDTQSLQATVSYDNTFQNFPGGVDDPTAAVTNVVSVVTDFLLTIS